jgi:hypothetical protein
MARHAGDFARRRTAGRPHGHSPDLRPARAHEVAGDAAAALGEYRYAELFHGLSRAAVAALANVVGLELDSATTRARASTRRARTARARIHRRDHRQYLHVATSFPPKERSTRLDSGRGRLRRDSAHDRAVFVADRLVDRRSFGWRVETARRRRARRGGTSARFGWRSNSTSARPGTRDRTRGSGDGRRRCGRRCLA